MERWRDGWIERGRKGGMDGWCVRRACEVTVTIKETSPDPDAFFQKPPHHQGERVR